MKKLVAVFFGLIVTSLFVTTVSAAEYEVKKGDTLWDIANSHDTTVDKIMKNNNLRDTIIYPKQILELDKEEETEIEYYTVDKGDTLSDISDQYDDDITIEYLKNVNNLNSDLIFAGQELIVGGVTAPVTKKVTTTSVENTTKEKPENKQVNNSEKVEKKKEQSEQKTVEKSKQAEVSSTESSEPNGKTIAVEATAYTAYCDGCSGITATGMNLKNNPNAKVIAVDPNVIPLGTEVYVEGYGHAVAADTGGAIKGNKIDIHVPTKDEAFNWGRRTVNVTIVN